MDSYIRTASCQAIARGEKPLETPSDQRIRIWGEYCELSFVKEECEVKCTLPSVIILILLAPLSPARRQLESLGGGGTREFIGAVGAIELAIAHKVRLDALGDALQASINIEALFSGKRGHC